MNEPVNRDATPVRSARGVLDLSGTTLIDRPSFVEEQLLKTQGVIAAEINVFSYRITVVFNPSQISLDKIKAMITPGDEAKNFLE
jgi:hypothetical protein